MNYDNSKVLVAVEDSIREVFDRNEISKLHYISKIESGEIKSEKVILDINIFTTIDEFILFKESYDGSILLFTPQEKINQVIKYLSDMDDYCLTDISEEYVLYKVRKFLNSKSNKYDPLTGLFIRNNFLQELENRLTKANDENPVSVLFIDIDFFKAINDNHGHTIGDAILKELAFRVKSEIAGDGLIARYGGEEIVVLSDFFEEESVTRAELILEKIRKEPIYKDIMLTASIGVNTTLRPVESEEFLKHLEIAIYTAKANGRDQAVHFSEVQQSSMESGISLELENFENMTRVISERVGKLLAAKGKKIFDELQRKAEIDPLTGLYNRRFFDNRLEYDLEISRSTSAPLSVALLDIDYFGQVNKKYDWVVGDAVLKQVSAIISQNIRSQDWVARYGGEEICVVLSSTKENESFENMDKMRELIANTIFGYNDVSMNITVSIGVYEFNGDEANVKDLMQKVSEQLLKAKNSGRNRVCSPEAKQ